MEPVIDWNITALIQSIIQHIKGRKGIKISQTDLKSIAFMESYEDSDKIVGSKKKLLINDIQKIITERNKIIFTGNCVSL
jgi:hypothetical protein